MPRFYDAEPVDRYLRAVRASFQGSVNTLMAATQRADDPRIESLQNIDRVLLAVQTELARYSVTIEPVVPEEPAEEDIVDAEEVDDDDVPSIRETQGGTA